MGKVVDRFREIQLRTLEDMKKRRDALDKGIVDLEYAIEHLALPLNIDFEAVDEEARRDIEFLDRCERVRKGEWVSS